MLERVALCILSVVAAIGLAASLIVHAATFSAAPPGIGYSGERALELGVFAVVMPAATLFAIRMRRSRTNQLSETPFAYIPLWLAIPTIAAGLYAGFLTIAAVGEAGIPAKQGDGYVLHSRGQVLRALTANEFVRAEASIVRVRTAQCAGFYLAALTMAVAALRSIPRESRAERILPVPSEVAPSPTIAKETSPDRPAGKSRPAWRVD